MEEKKLITREPNPEDGRSVLICLTEFGVEMREYSKGVVLNFDKVVREVISEQDLKTFNKVAKSIVDIANNKKYINKI